MGVLPSIGHALADNGAAAAAAWGDGRRAARAQDRRWTDLPSRSTVRREAVQASAIEPGTASLVEFGCRGLSVHAGSTEPLGTADVNGDPGASGQWSSARAAADSATAGGSGYPCWC